MLWTYHYEYGGHFRFASEATGFDTNMVAAGYYYRYLNPNVSSGLTEENSGNPNLNSQTVINYYNHQVANSGFNNYIGVVDEGNGNLRICGLASSSEAAEIILASVNSVPSTGYPDGPINHTVNHIDISIEGTTTIEAPLAYGNYYFDANQNEFYKTVSAAQPYTVEITQKVGIETADMKRATITATRADTGAVVNNAYYITGYSANAATEWSTPQVRIEGSFKVADMSPASWWNSNADYIRAQRLQNKIEYASDKKLYRYYVTEETVDGFWDPLYGFMDNDGELHTIPNGSKAEDGQYIINNIAGVALPNTGGPGTRLFTILGTILILGAGVLLLRRRRLI